MARETSLFSQQNESELSALNAKMSAGVQLTNAEAERKNQLEMQQRSFSNQKALAEQQFGFDKQLNDPLGLFS